MSLSPHPEGAVLAPGCLPTLMRCEPVGLETIMEPGGELEQGVSSPSYDLSAFGYTFILGLSVSLSLSLSLSLSPPTHTQ